MEMSNCKCHLSSLVMVLEAARTHVTAVRPGGTGGPVALVCFCHGPASGGHVEHEKASAEGEDPPASNKTFISLAHKPHNV